MCSGGSELEVSPAGGYVEEMGSGFAVAERRQNLGDGVQQADNCFAAVREQTEHF